MKNFKVKVVLAPDESQVKILLDTFDRYSELCNYISLETYDDFLKKPQDRHYRQLCKPNYVSPYEDVRNKFPDIDVEFIPLAFGRVQKAYKAKRPDEAYRFSGILDCSNLIVSIKFALPRPDNIGMLTIMTLSGYQDIYFLFDKTQRRYLSVAFNRSRFRAYQLVYQDDLFCLITDICSHNQINSLVDNPSITKTTINYIISGQGDINKDSLLQVAA